MFFYQPFYGDDQLEMAVIVSVLTFLKLPRKKVLSQEENHMKKTVFQLALTSCLVLVASGALQAADDKKAAAKTDKTADAASAEAKPKTLPEGFPADATYDVKKANGTTFPAPANDSSELKMGEHPRDLSKWLTRSHLDTRGVPEPKKVTLEGELNGNAEKGKEIAMNTAKGNCWACHALPGDAQPGNNGPSLLEIGKRGMTDAELYQIVYDRRVLNPTTAMPPYGSFETLADQEIRDVVAFLQTLK